MFSCHGSAKEISTFWHRRWWATQVTAASAFTISQSVMTGSSEFRLFKLATQGSVSIFNIIYLFILRWSKRMYRLPIRWLCNNAKCFLFFKDSRRTFTNKLTMFIIHKNNYHRTIEWDELHSVLFTTWFLLKKHGVLLFFIYLFFEQWKKYKLLLVKFLVF
jgi:hypothetical protein